MSSSGLWLLAQTAAVSGLSDALSAGLSRWRKPATVHDLGKVALDLVLAIAAGGDCLADVSLIWAQPELFGPVATVPTVSRLIDVLGADPAGAVAAIRSARASAGRGLGPPRPVHRL
nr:transposase [Aeromicrobium sp.]